MCTSNLLSHPVSANLPLIPGWFLPALPPWQPALRKFLRRDNPLAFAALLGASPRHRWNTTAGPRQQASHSKRWNAACFVFHLRLPPPRPRQNSNRKLRTNAGGGPGRPKEGGRPLGGLGEPRSAPWAFIKGLEVLPVSGLEDPCPALPGPDAVRVCGKRELLSATLARPSRGWGLQAGARGKEKYLDDISPWKMDDKAPMLRPLLPAPNSASIPR